MAYPAVQPLVVSVLQDFEKPTLASASYIEDLDKGYCQHNYLGLGGGVFTILP